MKQAKLSSFFTRKDTAPVPLVVPAPAPTAVVAEGTAKENVVPDAEDPPPTKPSETAAETDNDNDDDHGEVADDDVEEDDAAPSPRGGLAAPPGLSEYEKVRLENMRRNAEFLASLGLDSIKPTVTATAARPAPVKKRKLSPMKEVAPTRRSARVAGGPPKSTTYAEDDGDNDDDEEEEDEADVSYDDSSVLRYAMCSSATTSSGSGSGSGSSSGGGGLCGAVRSLSLRSARPMLSESLAAIYSLQFHPSAPLLMAAGKGGYVSLFRVGGDGGKGGGDHDDNDDDELMTFKAHDSWVAAAKFVAPSSSGASTAMSGADLPRQLLCVTASNDGSVKLFDLSKHRTGGKGAAGKLAAPQLLAQSTSIHARGVFSLDVWAPGSGSSGSGGDSGGSGGSGGSAAWADGVRVLTGSKDRQVCVSRLHASSSSSSSSSFSFVVDRAFDELHSGVVKCVHWADADTLGGGGGQVFASGGQDRAVCVKDCRSASAAPDVAIADAHSGGVHTVHWGPSGSGGPLLLTAGHDPLIHLYDVRWPAAPAVTLDTSSSAASATLRHTFRGHASPHARKHGTILPPRFVSASVVVAAGEGSDCLSLYCATTGATLSRGAMPDQPIAIACRGGGGGGGSGGAATEVAVSCRRGGAIYLLNPQSS